MKLVIISGRSGSGKSTALDVLEDLGYNCIDNLPIALMLPLFEEALKAGQSDQQKIAVSIDARNMSTDLSGFTALYARIGELPVHCEIIYLDAMDEVLLKRFNATRRKHPLTGDSLSLQEAIQAERRMLEPLAELADLHIDTSNLSLYDLRDLVKERISGHKRQELSLLFQSFGFKHGVPIDADLVFDVRCLANPFWDPGLRSYTGKDACVASFLEKHPETDAMFEDISSFLTSWLPKYQENNRSYITVAIGCTGGQHRSVYLAERLGAHFDATEHSVQVRHKELG